VFKSALYVLKNYFLNDWLRPWARVFLPTLEIFRPVIYPCSLWNLNLINTFAAIIANYPEILQLFF